MNCSTQFYNQFKPIRNKLKSFRKDQILKVCFIILEKIWNLDLPEILNKKLPLPWHTLLILKWGLVYGANKIEGKEFTEKAFSCIYNLINNLPINLKWFDSGEPFDIWRWLRANSAGQNPYQTNTGFYGLAVTEIILKDIGINYDIDYNLIKTTGLNLEEFINFQTLIVSTFMSNQNYTKYSLDYFKTFSSDIDLLKLDQFLKYSSLSFKELETYLSDHHKSINNPEFEYNMLSPLYKYPLFRNDGYYIPYNTTLLNNFCEHGLYDILKSNDSQDFSCAFGHGFETYLTYSLDNLNLEYYREKEMRRVFNVSSSVDFLIKGVKDILLIEAKSAEMSGLISHNPEMKYLEQTFQNSLIKGYKQIILSAHELKNQNPQKFNNADIWGLVVTYKDFMFGAPEAIWLEFMEKKMIDMLPKDIINDLPIDPMKIFVVSVFEYDSFCEYTLRRKQTLFESLEIPFKNNTNRVDNKFSFILHFPQDNMRVIDFKQTKTKLDEIVSRIKKY